MKCLSFAVNVCICEILQLFLICTEHTSPMSPVSGLKIMTTCIELKVLLKFGASEVCVELRAKKLRNVYRLP